MMMQQYELLIAPTMLMLVLFTCVVPKHLPSGTRDLYTFTIADRRTSYRPYRYTLTYNRQCICFAALFDCTRSIISLRRSQASNA